MKSLQSDPRIARIKIVADASVLVHRRALFVVAALGFQPSAFAGDPSGFAGVVRDQNKRPVDGAMVTITNRELERSTSVFAAKDGSFRMPTLERGLYDLRVRRVGYKDLSRERDFSAKARPAT